MYNKTLDVYIVVADQGSFTKASQKLHMTHTAVIKQMNQLESHLKVQLFKRTNHGITVTNTGKIFYKYAKEVIKYSQKAIAEVQAVHLANCRTIRVGTSTLYPCNIFMDLWDEIHSANPSFYLDVVPFTDSDERFHLLNDKIDFMVGVYNSKLENDLCSFIPLGEYRFSIAMPKSHPLSGEKSINFKDLCGYTLMIMTTGNSPINDKIRSDILHHYPEIRLEDIAPQYDTETFNQCANTGKALLSIECWDHIHPSLVNIPFAEDYKIPYGVIISSQPSSDILEFLRILKDCVQISKKL